jgi:hypothetical protein
MRGLWSLKYRGFRALMDELSGSGYRQTAVAA